MLLVLPLLNKLADIQGWMEYEEADLLIATTIRSCIELRPPHNIVEVGSYHGKSTVLIGSAVKALFPEAKVFAIDPHEGVVGAADQGLQALLPSLEMFKKNILAFGLSANVNLINDSSFNVPWSSPISFIFIDGLHDYENVARDFRHFERYIRKGCFVAFHDHAHYYPGVITFVNELLITGNYTKIWQAKSLVVLQSKIGI